MTTTHSVLKIQLHGMCSEPLTGQAKGHNRRDKERLRVTLPKSYPILSERIMTDGYAFMSAPAGSIMTIVSPLVLY